MQWLSVGGDQQDDHLDRLSEMRQSDTCNWILQDAQVQPWIEDVGGDPIVWMAGLPGGGKSVLCSLVIQNLLSRVDQSCLYYFCSKNASGGDNSATVLRTFAIQLLLQNPSLKPLVYEMYLQKSTTSLPAIRKMLIEIIPTATITRIVIDGIDEVGTSLQLNILKDIIQLQKYANCGLKILVSSREEPQIQQQLKTKSHMRLGDKTSGGLALYISKRVKEIRTYFPDIDPALAVLVEERLRSKASGMFLWVRLVAAMLMLRASEVEVETAIHQLPDGLMEAYGRILKRIEALGSALKDRAFKVLFWICIAFRPVKINEVTDGIALHPTQRKLSKKTRSNNPRRDLVELCAPLLDQRSDGTLDVVHFSAAEFLLGKQSGPFICTAKAHHSIALSCIINLTTSLELVPGCCEDLTDVDLETRVVQGAYRLCSYGHEYWAEHLMTYLSQSKDPDPGFEELMSILRDFSRAYKHRPEKGLSHISNMQDEERCVGGFQKLRPIPVLYNFLLSWLRFKSNFRKSGPELNTLLAQQEWKLKTDETFLSLIDFRLNKITEGILKMRCSDLPSHIDESDYKTFINQSELACRYFDCNHRFNSVESRTLHEESHAISFPCHRCDFAQRGFRSRKDLERHVRTYHMSPEDFEVPEDLHGIYDAQMEDKGGSKGRSLRASSCWNEEGHKALQRSFSQVLDKIGSRIALDKESQSKLNQINRFEEVKAKLKVHQYQNLAEFKDDIHQLYRASAMGTARGDVSIDFMIEKEIEDAVSEFPAFADIQHPQSQKNIFQ